MKDAQAIVLKLGEGLSTHTTSSARRRATTGRSSRCSGRRSRPSSKLGTYGVVYGVDITGDQGGKGVAAGDEKEAAATGTTQPNKKGN